MLFRSARLLYPPKLSKDIVGNRNYFVSQVVVVGRNVVVRGIILRVSASRLRNILKKIQLEYTQIRPIKNGDLTYLAKQGVLLINRTLTVRDSQANCHQKIWDKFTPTLLKEILLLNNKKENPLVLLLWGQKAVQVLKDMDPDMENLPTDYVAGTDFRLAKTTKGQYADYSTSKWARKRTSS